MRKLGFTDKEIKEVLEDDKRIDKGEKLFELNTEQEKASKQARKMTRAPVAYKLDNTAGKRSKKSDEVKAGLIELISTVIQEQPACNNLEVLNPEREITFMWMGKKYKITLSAPRTQEPIFYALFTKYHKILYIFCIKCIKV